MEDFDLFVSYCAGTKSYGWFHGNQCEELEDMVLYHVADGSRLFVVGATALYANVFCDGDLDMVNIAPVPDRFKDAVCQAENKNILYCFFTEVVVNTIDLFFSEDFR